MDVSSEFMVQFETKTGTGVENLHHRSFLDGMSLMLCVIAVIWCVLHYAGKGGNKVSSLSCE